MAHKDISLNPKIINAAKEEFLNKGFEAASINMIAKKAQVTTGAIYTRYESKEALFCGLLEDLIKVMDEQKSQAIKLYEHAGKTGALGDVFAAMHAEELSHLDLFFQYYDECKLLFCCSNGTCLERKMQDDHAQKAQDTWVFMQTFTDKTIDKNVIELLIKQGFTTYRYIFQKSLTKDEAISLVKKMQKFYGFGWHELFKELR